MKKGNVSKKVMICVPNLNLQGGVGNFYRVCKRYFSSNIFYHQVSSSFTGKLAKAIINPFFLLLTLARILVIRPSIVVVNPSLGVNSIVRDGVIIWFSILLGRKTIVFWRGWNPELEGILHYSAFRLIFRSSFLRADEHIVLNSLVNSSLIGNGVDPQRICFSNTVVDDSYLSIDRVGHRDGNFVVLFLTRIERYKGIYEALEVARKLPDDVELHIAGDGSEMDGVRDYVESLGLNNVKILGYVTGKRKVDAFMNASIYLFPSYNEGMPNSVLEAMACGLAVVCTRVGALKDFFVDEEMGYSSDVPVVVGNLVNGIKMLIGDKDHLERISSYNRDYAAKNFKASVTASSLERIFSRVLSRE